MVWPAQLWLSVTSRMWKCWALAGKLGLAARVMKYMQRIGPMTPNG